MSGTSQIRTVARATPGRVFRVQLPTTLQKFSPNKGSTCNTVHRVLNHENMSKTSSGSPHYSMSTPESSAGQNVESNSHLGGTQSPYLAAHHAGDLIAWVSVDAIRHLILEQCIANESHRRPMPPNLRLMSCHSGRDYLMLVGYPATPT
jgi:hypothetical protein